MKQHTGSVMPTEQKNSYTYNELIQCAEGRLFGTGNAQLPLPPMLMFDRISHISKQGGKHNKGEVIAQLDVDESLWFFACHFQDDPVMPGCLGLDAMWQLIGFFLGWSGGIGKGRALGCGAVKFAGQILPSYECITYRISLSRVIRRQLYMGVADGVLEADGNVIYEAKDLKVGLFTDTSQF